MNANVGAATAGSPVTELLGSGAAATPNQTFMLKQTPLTYTQAQTPTGTASSLEVSVNGASWTLVPTLYKQASRARVFAAANLTGGSTQVIFGDGVEGSTIPTGQNNIIANYRIGLGAAGNVDRGLHHHPGRPAHRRERRSQSHARHRRPGSAAVDDIQADAPMSVQTLGRAVSITDYQNFAATFAGIAKASCGLASQRLLRGVFLTVARRAARRLPPGNPHPGRSCRVASRLMAIRPFRLPSPPSLETLFGFEADLTMTRHTDRRRPGSVMALLNSTYSFANRTFGQGVSADELDAVIQSVPGVIAVNMTSV